MNPSIHSEIVVSMAPHTLGKVRKREISFSVNFPCLSLFLAFSAPACANETDRSLREIQAFPLARSLCSLKPPRSLRKDTHVGGAERGTCKRYKLFLSCYAHRLSLSLGYLALTARNRKCRHGRSACILTNCQSCGRSEGLYWRRRRRIMTPEWNGIERRLD